MEPKFITDIYTEEYEDISISTVDASVPISSGGNLQLRMWVADNSKPIRGVLVGCHYLGGNWLNFVTRTAWQNLAREHNFAVIGLFFNNSGNDPNKDGGTKALVDGINVLASNSGHSEVKNAPICIYGFSAGGGFSAYFAQYAPMRTISFAHNKGVSIEGVKFTGTALTVPGFAIYGSDDSSRIPGIKNTFSINRGAHAQWALLVDWGQGHNEAGNAEPIALEYFSDLIEKRLPANYVPGNSYTLVVIDENSGWLGDNNTFEPGPAKMSVHSAYTGNVYSASWLPDSYLAYKWCNVVSRNGSCNQSSPCGQPTCYKCVGTSCIQDNVNGTYVSCTPNPCVTNGLCGQPTCYKCFGSSCIQDNANGTYTTCTPNPCGTNGPCGQPTCYKCDGTICIQDNVNGTYVSCTPNPCGTNGLCGKSTCYKCDGTSCIQDNANGTYTSCTPNPCGTNGPCGQPTCYKCDGTTCVQDNANGKYTSCTPNPCSGSNGGGDYWFQKTTCFAPSFCVQNKYIALGTGIIILALLLKK